jgi:hypothetical protein
MAAPGCQTLFAELFDEDFGELLGVLAAEGLGLRRDRLASRLDQRKFEPKFGRIELLKDRMAECMLRAC